MDYISRDELRKHLADCMTAEFFDSDMKKAVVGIDVYVENMPAADVKPIKCAKWILFDKDKIGRAFHCSNCRKVTTTDDFENSPLEREEYYCPRCGADMRGEQNDN